MTGYVGYSMSNNAVDAYDRGLSPAFKMAAILGVRGGAKTLADFSADEWHHTSKKFNKTRFFSVREIMKQAVNDDDLLEILVRNLKTTSKFRRKLITLWFTRDARRARSDRNSKLSFFKTRLKNNLVVMSSRKHKVQVRDNWYATPPSKIAARIYQLEAMFGVKGVYQFSLPQHLSVDSFRSALAAALEKSEAKNQRREISAQPRTGCKGRRG